MKRKPGVLLIQPPIYDFGLYDLFLKPWGLYRLGSWFSSAGFHPYYLNGLDWNDGASEDSLGKPARRKNGTGKFFRQIVSLPEHVHPIEKRFSRYGILPESLEQRIRAVADHIDIIAVTTGMTYWYQGIAETASLVRRLLPGKPLLLGGIYATLMPQHAAAVTGADFIASGEDTEGLRTYLEHRGFPVPSGAVPQYPDSEQLPGKEAAQVIRINEGCPYHCSYCASEIVSPRYSPGDPDTAFHYLKTLHDFHGVRHVAFYDDALLARRERVMKPLLRRIIEEKLSFTFYTPNAVHVRYLDEETALLMKEAGFREVRMGFESSSSEFHEELDGKFAENEFYAAVRNLGQAGFAPSQLPVYVLAGLPGQYAEEVEDSIRKAAESGASVSIAEYSPVPGTQLWDQALALSQVPLADEPLYHNNKYFPTEWSRFTRADMARLKALAALTRR